MSCRATPKYRMRKLRDGKRVRVVEHLGVEGYIASPPIAPGQTT